MIAFLLIALAFLFLLCVLALAAARVFGAKTPEGQRTAPGCLGGCAMFVVLTGLGIAGLAVLIAGAIASGDKGPLREIARDLRNEIHKEVQSRHEVETRPSERSGKRRAVRGEDGTNSSVAPSESSSPADEPNEHEEASNSVRIVVRWDGHSEPRLELLDALRRAGLAGDVRLEVAYEQDDAGTDRTVVTLFGSGADEDIEVLGQHVDAVLDELSEKLDVRVTRVELEIEDLR